MALRFFGFFLRPPVELSSPPLGLFGDSLCPLSSFRNGKRRPTPFYSRRQSLSSPHGRGRASPSLKSYHSPLPLPSFRGAHSLWPQFSPFNNVFFPPESANGYLFIRCGPTVLFFPLSLSPQNSVDLIVPPVWLCCLLSVRGLSLPFSLV